MGPETVRGYVELPLMFEERVMEENGMPELTGMFELATSIRAIDLVHACSASVVDLNLYSQCIITSDVRNSRTSRKRKLWINLGLQPPSFQDFMLWQIWRCNELYMTCEVGNWACSGEVLALS